jgi:hypothetical protein
MRAILLAAAVFFALDACARATAIIAVWDPSFVIIGADGRETMTPDPPKATCKITIAGNVSVAIAGKYELGKMFTLDTFIKDEFSKDGSISVHIDNIETGTFNVIKHMNDMRTGAIPYRGPTISPYGLAIGLFFAYPDFAYPDTVFMRAEYYVVALDPLRNEITPTKIFCPGLNCPPRKAFPLGESEDILSVLNANPGLAYKLGVAGAIRANK